MADKKNFSYLLINHIVTSTSKISVDIVVDIYHVVSSPLFPTKIAIPINLQNFLDLALPPYPASRFAELVSGGPLPLVICLYFFALQIYKIHIIKTIAISMIIKEIAI